MSYAWAIGCLIQCDFRYSSSKSHQQFEVDMQFGAAGATYQMVGSVLRMQVMTAAEYDREGTLHDGCGPVDVDIGGGSGALGELAAKAAPECESREDRIGQAKDWLMPLSMKKFFPRK